MTTPDQKRFEEAIRAEEDRYQQRVKQLDATAPDASRPGGDKKLGEGFYHNPVAQNEHISKKTYYFPPSFNALRRELQDHWKDFFETISPLTGTSPAWCMVFDAPQFIGFMNGFTGLSQQMDSENVEGICFNFLNALRKMRGVSEFNA